jgi:hypothetical protein
MFVSTGGDHTLPPGLLDPLPRGRDDGPDGAHGPLERQATTVSAPATSVDGATPGATAAFLCSPLVTRGLR